jgi:hypothetical protein
MAIVFAHHMKDNIIVGLVAVVSMTQPIGGLGVYLYVSHPHSAVYLQLSIEEIGAGIGVGQTRIDNLYQLASSGSQLAQREDFMLPNVVK